MNASRACVTEYVIPFSAFDGGVHCMGMEAQNGLSEAWLPKQCRALMQRLGPRLRVRYGASQHPKHRGARVPKAGFLCNLQRRIDLACGVVAGHPFSVEPRPAT